MVVLLGLNLMGDIGVLWKFRIAKNRSVPISKMAAMASWNSSNHISSQTVSQIELKLDGRHQDDMEIQNFAKLRAPVA